MLRLRYILPALLVGSGLKQPGLLWCKHRPIDSPGFIGREWIETRQTLKHRHGLIYSPGFIGREWIETVDRLGFALSASHSPGFTSREWIETRS